MFCTELKALSVLQVYNPRNTEAVELHFRGEKTAKVVGKMAMTAPVDGEVLSGVLVRRNFNYHLMHADDLSTYTELSNSILTQRESVFYNGSVALLLDNLQQISGDASLEEIDSKDSKASSHLIKLFDGRIQVSLNQPLHVAVIEWSSNPVSDMFADAAVAAILHAQMNPLPDKRMFACEFF
ncbi:unnamed protein product, partial [Gongylonema pulchrum]|uniref:CPSF73-100_C domain-containing protein n=1 Tax=Gongylonema pulchrum TaxID=637853 RepID=A0A183D242_9BILA